MTKKKKLKQTNLDPVKKLIYKKSKDGDLSDNDIDEIIKETKALYKDSPLSKSDITEIYLTAIKDVDKANQKTSKVPVLLRILGVGMIIAWLSIIPTLIHSSEEVSIILKASTDYITTTTILVVIAYMIVAIGVAVLSIITGILMLLNKRKWAGRILFTSIAFSAILIIITIILDGADNILFYNAGYGIFQIIVSIYLQPKLYQERNLQKKLINLDLEQRSQEGRLGMKVDKSQGYIELDFFNIFWIFVAGCIIGLIAEYVFHIFFVWGFNPENWYDRAGLLFGPFSPIYGFGAVFMTLFLNRLYNLHPIPLFALTTLIGGCFEFIVSWFLETAFGVEAWNYTGMFLSLNGRTCLLFACMFGAMGFIWIKWALPAFMKIINKIPWKLRYPITFIFSAFMIVNCIMTIQSIDCWSQRVAGKTPISPIEQFYEANYDDEFMAKRFASMNIQSDKSSRSDLEETSD